MLYNQNWERPNNDVWSLDNLIGWLGTKSGTYDYDNPRKCLLYQYLEEMGEENLWCVDNHHVKYKNEGFIDLPPQWAEIAGQQIFSDAWTFEKALERALKVKAEQMVEA